MAIGSHQLAMRKLQCCGVAALRDEIWGSNSQSAIGSHQLAMRKLQCCFFAALRDKIWGSNSQLAFTSRQFTGNQAEFKLRLCGKIGSYFGDIRLH